MFSQGERTMAATMNPMPDSTTAKRQVARFYSTVEDMQHNVQQSADEAIRLESSDDPADCGGDRLFGGQPPEPAVAGGLTGEPRGSEPVSSTAAV